MRGGRVHDVVGVGLGPFNLGLACLLDPVTEVDAVFLEARSRFAWHPGMLLPRATLQVPFLADLVTMADPTSPFSYLSFLKDVGRLYPFYIRESFYPLRREYDEYCRWAADRLSSVRFGAEVARIEHDGASYVLHTRTGEVYRGLRLVLGTGTSPYVPTELRRILKEPGVTHSAHYLSHKPDLQARRTITVVGSGQSAAEVYADLLAEIDDHEYELVWLTRSPRFFPMEYTKLTLEMTSPDYTRYFQSLPEARRHTLLREQRSLYKGISAETVNEIYDALYARQVAGGTDTSLLTSTAVVGARRASGGYELELRHLESGEAYTLRTDAVIAATGYRGHVPEFLTPIRDRIALDEQGRYAADEQYAVDHARREIFVQNGEEHTHGFVAPDLGMGAFRNSVIIAALLGREVYPVESRIAFQEFGAPSRLTDNAPAGAGREGAAR
ncbi:lysine N(6)-hydroxylase/L-ornithine N(5)-oxygenase family protein [Georgenia deserti]|uniref:L-lysine N6-monooxygenase MbtG n=1 Tax=Georgenia deserti TaxID=2093781 RepID=A0ABW4L785_9MICO